VRAEQQPAIRVDVDFRVGMQKAVPYMANLLARNEMRATFFLVTGWSPGRSWLRKLARPAVLRRWLRIGAWRLAGRADVWGELFRRSETADYEALLGSTVALLDSLGHEVALHGFDHEWWVDEVWRATPTRLTEEMDRAYDAARAATGRDDFAWGSPGWRTCDSVMRDLAKRGVPYLAECWGRGPFRTRLDDGACLTIPHHPITVRSSESMAGRSDTDVATSIAESCVAHSRSVCCLHDYYEGLLRPGLLEALVDALRGRGLHSLTLAEASRNREGDLPSFPACRVGRRRVPGFVGEVSVQEGER